MSGEYDNLYKIILVGDSAVGKSSLMTRYTENYYNNSFISTIGVDFKIKNIIVDGKKVKLQIWDTAGQERFRTIANTYYRGANCCIITFGLDDTNSFYNVKEFIDNCQKFANQNILMILVGTKSDLRDKSVTSQMINNCVNEYNIKYFETSSKTNQGINELFEYISRELSNKQIQKYKKNSIFVPIKQNNYSNNYTDNTNNNKFYFSI
jgi:small GTP-binding protein